MILGFRSRALKRFWEKSDPRGLNPKHIRKIERILSALQVARIPEDMNQPGSDFHKLTGLSPDRWSVHVNGNWCVTFSFDGQDVADVDLEDYH